MLAVNTKAIRQADCIRVEVSSLATGTKVSIMATNYHNVVDTVATNTLAKQLEHNVIQVTQDWKVDLNSYFIHNQNIVAITPIAPDYQLVHQAQSVPHSLFLQVRLDCHVEEFHQILGIA